jgi:hypothetical protein
MKYSFIIFTIFIFLFSACGKKEKVKLTAYNATAFAYDLGNSWEVDATTRVKGYMQKEEKGTFNASLAYEINLITPKDDTIKSLITKVVDKSEKEKMPDTNLEAQFDLDSTYTDGKYTIIFKVKDVLSGDTASSSAGFDLSRE